MIFLFTAFHFNLLIYLFIYLLLYGLTADVQTLTSRYDKIVNMSTPKLECLCCSKGRLDIEQIMTFLLLIFAFSLA